MKGLDSYDSDSKQAFREWAIEQIKTRTKTPPMWAKIMYLAGPKDVDRDALVGAGFNQYNLIAVDICENRVAKARKDGTIALASNINYIAAAWKDDPLDVLYLDTCSTLGWWQGFLGDASIGSMIGLNTLIIVNLVRGHTGGEALRKITAQCNIKLWDKQPVGIHRGRLAYSFLLELTRHAAEQHPDLKMRLLLGGEESFVAGMWNHSHPQFYSYRNSNTTMDAVAMHSSLGQWQEQTGWKSRREPSGFAKARKKLVAAKAVRSRLWKCN